MERIDKVQFFLSISRSNILTGINKLQIKDASKKIYNDVNSIFSGKPFFKECQVLFLSKVSHKFYVYIIPIFNIFYCF